MCENPRIENPLLASIYTALQQAVSVPPDCPPLTLIESPHGLDVTLTPRQRLIIGLAGASRTPDMKYVADSPDTFRDLRFLLGESSGPPRIWLPPGTTVNAENTKLEISFSEPVTTILCVAGRRSGKTTLASFLMAWLAHRIVRYPSFLDGLPLLPGSLISLINVACDTFQGRLLFSNLVANLGRLGLVPDGTTATERLNIGRLQMESLNSSSRSARGRTTAGVCMDEFAHFQRTQGPLADRSMWLALMPSLATFGKRSLAVITTTPAGTSGVVWDLFRSRGNRAGMLTVQMPTWVMNSHIKRESLDEEFGRDDYMARQEYGAEFLTPEGRYLDPERIRACVRMEKPSYIAPHARWHLHVDLGLVNDATTLALGYITRDSSRKTDWTLNIDRVEVLRGTRGVPVSVREIEERIDEISGEVPLSGVTFDQHQSAYIIERLNSRGIPAQGFPATAKSNQEVFSFLRDLINTGRIELPDHPLLISELGNLCATPTSYGFRVEASPGHSDDCADAVACCAWLLAGDGSYSWVDIFRKIESEW